MSNQRSGAGGQFSEDELLEFDVSRLSSKSPADRTFANDAAEALMQAIYASQQRGEEVQDPEEVERHKLVKAKCAEFLRVLKGGADGPEQSASAKVA